MHAYAEILDPSVISHALFVSLGSTQDDNLIIIRGGSLLQVYTDIYSPRGPRWLAELPLDGTVTHLNTLDGKNVVVTFKTAKLVLLEWDPSALTFSTRSLHYYEKLAEESKFDPSHDHESLLTVDASKNCMVFQHEHNAAVLVRRREFTNPLFPKSQQASGHELRSSELPLAPFVPGESYVDVVDVAHLPIYTVPTVALLYWTEPSWPGLNPKYGDRTKGIVIANVVGNRSRGTVLSIAQVCEDAFQIVPVQSPGNILLLIGSNSLSVINEAGVLVDLTLDDQIAQVRFENCQAAELKGTEWIMIVLESGALVSVNMTSHKVQLLKPAGYAPEPTCLAVGRRNTFLIGSRLGAGKLCKADIRPQSIPQADLSNFTLKGFYEEVTGQTTKPAVILGLNELFTFANLGSLGAVVPIDDGLACSSGSNIVIVERELPLIESYRVDPAVPVSPGRFWVLNDTNKDSKLLLVSSKTLEELDKESVAESESGEPHTKKNKRRRTKQAREATLFYDVSMSSKQSVLKLKDRQRPKQIRAFATDQATLTVQEGSEIVVVVQTRSLSVYERGTWKLVSATPIPPAYSAEIQGGLILTRHRDGDETRVYSSVDLSLVRTVAGQQHSTISREFLVQSQRSWLSVTKPSTHEVTKTYDLTRLDQRVKPTDTREGNGLDLVSIFLLDFSGTSYVGVHLNRLFCIYEPVGDALVKRFTVPFMVNQSPIWLSAAQMLIFPGEQSHVVAKSRVSNFTCHLLQTDGLRMLDAAPCMEGSVGNKDAPSAFVWLDQRQRLHFARVDSDIDYFSNKLPFRRISVDPEITIQDLAYHDDTQCLIIGANRQTIYTPPSSSEDTEPKEESSEDVKAEIDESSSAAEETSTMSARGFTGCVFTLPLSNYAPLEATSVEFARYETVISLECVDHCDAGGRQLVAIGTATATEEDAQCNGHICLYRVDEQSGRDDEPPEDRHENPKLSFFAKDYLRGAVSSIAEVMGFLAVAHGQQIHVYNFHKELEPVGFFDTEIYMKDMKAVRNLLLLGEELRGPRLVNFGLQPHRMDLLSSQDVPSAREAHAPLTVVEGVSSAAKGDMCLVSCDTNGRLQVLQYDPENPESDGGTRFVPLASFHTGRHCVSLAAVELANADLVAYGATKDGVIFSVAPISEEVFRTLFVLTQQMIDKEESLAGLNPRAHRQMAATLNNHQHHLIDFGYAQRLWNLPLDRQVTYSRKLGSNGLDRAHRALNSQGRNSLKL